MYSSSNPLTVKGMRQVAPPDVPVARVSALGSKYVVERARSLFNSIDLIVLVVHHFVQYLYY